MRTALISAIAAYSEERSRTAARRFLQGLSRDELQYIAEFLGACVLESGEPVECTHDELADGILHFEHLRRARAADFADRRHKMTLLLEYLRRCSLNHYSLSVRAHRP